MECWRLSVRTPARIRQPPAEDTLTPASVRPARLQLPLLDPQVARELGIVPAHLLDETLRVLAADEGLGVFRAVRADTA
jgi:hypothetical protein